MLVLFEQYVLHLTYKLYYLDCSVRTGLRVARVAPPPAPTLSEAYSTPYDEAYYYYGARNPLDPNLTNCEWF